MRSAGGARTESVGRGVGEASRADDERQVDDGPVVAFEYPRISCLMHRNVPLRVAAFGGTSYRVHGKRCTRKGMEEMSFSQGVFCWPLTDPKRHAGN